MAAVIRGDETILLVNHVKDCRSYWLLPGGGVEFGEPLGLALYREVREETGLDISPERLSGVYIESLQHGPKDVIHFAFVCSVVAPRTPRPDGVEAWQASLLEPIAVGLNTVDRLRILLGETVVVLGQGPIGLAITRLAALSGAGRQSASYMASGGGS